MGDDDRPRAEVEGLLVEMSRNGHPERFRDLVVRYQRPVFSICIRMVGHWADAEDLSQQTFLDAFAKLGTFQVGRPFAPWIYRIALNNCKDFLKSRKRSEVPDERDVVPEEALFHAPEASPEERHARAELGRRLTKALLKLPVKYRSVIVCKDVQDMAYKEIEQVLELPVTTLKIRVIRAREKLAKILRSEELENVR